LNPDPKKAYNPIQRKDIHHAQTAFRAGRRLGIGDRVRRCAADVGRYRHHRRGYPDLLRAARDDQSPESVGVGPGRRGVDSAGGDPLNPQLRGLPGAGLRVRRRLRGNAVPPGVR
jgi:hypothetical protein